MCVKPPFSNSSGVVLWTGPRLTDLLLPWFVRRRTLRVKRMCFKLDNVLSFWHQPRKINDETSVYYHRPFRIPRYFELKPCMNFPERFRPCSFIIYFRLFENPHYFTLFLACANSCPSSLPARVAFHAKRHSDRERRTAVFAGYYIDLYFSSCDFSWPKIVRLCPYMYLLCKLFACNACWVLVLSRVAMLNKHILC